MDAKAGLFVKKAICLKVTMVIYLQPNLKLLDELSESRKFIKAPEKESEVHRSSIQTQRISD